VRVDKPGQHDASAGIDDLCIGRHLPCYLIRSAERGYDAIAHEHSAMTYNRDVTELSADSRTTWTGERDKLRRMENRERVHEFEN